MKALRKLSIRNKLIGIIALATILPLAAGFVAVIISDVRALKQELVETAVLIARVTAENSVSDVAFSDRDASQKTLSKLASIPAIRWAVVFEPNGNRFATYAARGRHVPQQVRVADGIRSFDIDELRVSEPIVYGNDRYGTIVLSMSTGGLATKVRDHSIVLLVVLIACVTAAMLLARQLEKIVSQPILDLAATTREISEKHDYSVRVPQRSEDEVGVLAAGFNEMLTQIQRRQRERDEADQRTREKSQFLANMSHELRTPLNAIIGFSEVLRTRLEGRIESREERFLDNINSSGQHLLGIVNDILDLSKIEAGRMEVTPERFMLRNAVEGVCSLMRGVSSRRKITFQLDLDDSLPLIEADPVKVKQILYNLLSNAVKFSPEHSTVIIRTRAMGAYAVRMSVIDRGIGIDKLDHERIFQEFQQVDSTMSRQFEGTGLGLTLVKKFVEMHAGAIELQSALGEGSCFTVTLPLRFRGLGLDVAHSQPVSGRTVLVIEDDENAYRAIEKTLRAADYVTHHARSGEEGIALARELQPAAIALDLVLTGIDGIDVLRSLKNDPRTSRLPVLVVGDHATEQASAVVARSELSGQKLVNAIRELVPL
jgi:signal transduction histidine kinase